MTEIPFPIARPGSIAKGMGCSAETVRNAIRDLRAAGQLPPMDSITHRNELTIDETLTVVRHLRRKRG